MKDVNLKDSNVFLKFFNSFCESFYVFLFRNGYLEEKIVMDLLLTSFGIGKEKSFINSLKTYMKKNFNIYNIKYQSKKQIKPDLVISFNNDKNICFVEVKLSKSLSALFLGYESDKEKERRELNYRFIQTMPIFYLKLALKYKIVKEISQSILWDIEKYKSVNCPTDKEGCYLITCGIIPELVLDSMCKIEGSFDKQLKKCLEELFSLKKEDSFFLDIKHNFISFNFKIFKSVIEELIRCYDRKKRYRCTNIKEYYIVLENLRKSLNEIKEEEKEEILSVKTVIIGIPLNSIS